jgi:hypothetical protein
MANKYLKENEVHTISILSLHLKQPMGKTYLVRFVVLLALFIKAMPAVAQFDEASKRKIKYQISTFGVISFFRNDDRVTANTHAGEGAGIGLRAEIPITKGVKLVPGLDLLSQGFNFDSYYFAPGYSVLFDNHLYYNHAIRTNELDFPLLLKFSLNKKGDDAPSNFFASGGWELKYNFNSHTTSGIVYDGDTQLAYDSHFLGPNLGNYLVAALGFNRNFLPKKHSLVIDLTYRYALSSNIYTGRQSTNHILFRNINLSFGIGLRF